MKQQLGWMGFFMLLVLVIAFAFIIIGMNSENAVRERGQTVQGDDTEAPGYDAYVEKTTGQTGTIDVMLMRGLAIAVVLIMILIGIGMLVKTIGATWRRLRGGSRGTGT